MVSVIICTLMAESVDHCPPPLHVADGGGQGRIELRALRERCLDPCRVYPRDAGTSMSHAMFGTYLYQKIAHCLSEIQI